jgi:hypothetical protein
VIAVAVSETVVVTGLAAEWLQRNCTVPLAAPAIEAVNRIVALQLAPAKIVPSFTPDPQPQVLSAREKPAPVTLIPPAAGIVAAVWPLFVKVRSRFLENPIVVGANASGLGAAAIAGGVCPVPVSEAETVVTAAPAKVQRTLAVPDEAAAAVGANRSVTRQEPAAGTVPAVVPETQPQVFATTEKGAADTARPPAAGRLAAV